MIIDISSSNWNLLGAGLISFAIGAIGTIVYKRLKELLKSLQRSEQGVVEALVSEYTRRLNNYDKVIAELRVKVDTMELQLQQQTVRHQNVTSGGRDNHNISETTSQQSYASQNSRLNASELPTTISLSSVNGNSNDTTIDYILKMLEEHPRSARDIQHIIGRTREHTSRLMKKLHELRYVNRDSSTKPFQYSITDAGRIQLKEKSHIK
jgi:hypothetical protein